MRIQSATSYVPRKNYFSQTVQAAGECRAIVTSPFDKAPHGSRRSLPCLVSLVKHIKHGDNKCADTLAHLAVGYRAIEVPKFYNVGMFLKLASFTAALYPAESPKSIDDLNERETQLQAAFDQIQVKLWRKDYSARTLTEALESLYKIRTMVDELIAWVERRLYGEKQ